MLQQLFNKNLTERIHDVYLERYKEAEKELNILCAGSFSCIDPCCNTIYVLTMIFKLFSLWEAFFGNSVAFGFFFSFLCRNKAMLVSMVPCWVVHIKSCSFADQQFFAVRFASHFTNRNIGNKRASTNRIIPLRCFFGYNQPLPYIHIFITKENLIKGYSNNYWEIIEQHRI